jgi:hypothetical protein
MKTKALVAVPVSERPKKDGDYLTNNGNRHYWANCFWVPKGELKTYTVDSEITHWYEEKEVIIIDPTEEGREAVEFKQWWDRFSYNKKKGILLSTKNGSDEELYQLFLNDKQQSKTP